MSASTRQQREKIWPIGVVIAAVVFAVTTAVFKSGYRWYDEEMVQRGSALYQTNCAACHKANAEGDANWKQRDAAGNLPPPPLNGTAHAWHHSKAVLLSQILEGGQQYDGTMPGFGHKLTSEEAEAIIAFFQSRWSDEIYQNWADRNG